jgi:hypothetical protein
MFSWIEQNVDAGVLWLASLYCKGMCLRFGVGAYP